HRKAAGKRFGDMMHQRWRDGTEQKKPPVPFSIGIDRTAQSRKDLRPLLSFIENDEAIPSNHLLPRKVETEPIPLLLQIEISLRERPRQRRLSALTWSDQCH